MTRRTLVIIGIVALAVCVAGALTVKRTTTVFGGVPASARAPDGVRIRVQVLNASTVRGLAHRATELLRDRGFDVVDVGTTSERSDSTFILERSGHPEWSSRVAAVMGKGARVMSRPDSSRYLDITVLVGAAWVPPSLPFHP